MENKNVISTGSNNQGSIPSTPAITLNNIGTSNTGNSALQSVVEIKGPVDFKDAASITVNKISIHDPVGIELRILISNWDIKDMTKEDSGYARGTTEQAQQILDIINQLFN